VIVISDSSPLITLARAGYLELLREFSREIAISQDVIIDEVSARRAAKSIGLEVAGSVAVLERLLLDHSLARLGLAMLQQ